MGCWYRHVCTMATVVFWQAHEDGCVLAGSKAKWWQQTGLGLDPIRGMTPGQADAIQAGTYFDTY